MKKILLIIVGVFFFSSATFAFTDTDNSWYLSSITELKKRGVVSGFDNGTFLPRSEITRAELLKIILLTAKIVPEETDGKQCFSDVLPNLWYAKYICTGAKLGFVKGYENGTFAPNGKITVLEAITFAARALKVELPKQSVSESWYERYILFAHTNNIIPKNAYTLDTLVTRGQASEIILKIEQFSKKQTVTYQSKGCGTSSTLPATNTITINGKERQYLAVLPSNYDSEKAYPLMIGLHGRTNSNEMVKNYMKLSGSTRGGGRFGAPSSTAHDVIALYPAGLGSGPYSWSEPENVDFFDAMLVQVASKLCVDKSQVNIVGHSLGGYFANKLACERGDVIATMSEIGGPSYKSKCSGPVASLVIHNTDDSLVAFSSGERAVEIHKEENKCTNEVETKTFGSLSCKVRSHCSAGNPVVFCTGYQGAGGDPHSWPTTGTTAIYEFINFVKGEINKK